MKALPYSVVRPVRGEDLLAQEAMADQKETYTCDAVACRKSQASVPRSTR
jgi:hypothetical protein